MSRSAFQGVSTVVRFNWHLYALALGGATILSLVACLVPAWLARPLLLLPALVVLSVAVSLTATWLAYDSSGLYRLRWLDPWMPAGCKAANIHAGFDETTGLLRTRFPAVSWHVLDFYDPVKHTEISIRRARRAHPPATDTTAIPTRNLPFADAFFDRILLTLAAHEIRDTDERIGFFRELHRTLADNGLLIVTEHLRDPKNIAVYNLGAWHFHSPSAWKTAFATSRFEVVAVLKPAPLITTFILKKHGYSF